MKKKYFRIAVLILALILSFGIGVLLFSTDNIENAVSGLKTAYYPANNGLILQNWVPSEGGYVSNDDPMLIIDDANAYVSAIRLDGRIDPSVTAVEVFYTEDPTESFSAEKMFSAPITRKNNDVYIPIDRAVCDLRVDVYHGAGMGAEINGLEINSKKLNVDAVSTILTFLFTACIGLCTIEIIDDRKSLKKDLCAMKRYKFLLWDLVSKDVKTKYRRSVLGILWSVLNPLLMMLVLTAVFSNIIRVEIEGGYALFYLTGYIMFNFISEATSFSLHSITGAAALIKKVYIPKYIFPLEKSIFSLVNMLFSLIAFVIVFVFFTISGSTAPHMTMLLFPLPMIYIFLFCLGLCLILSALLVFFRDIGHIWGILLTVWMYASPILFPITLVPEWLANVIKLNPLYYYIDYFRNVMIYGKMPTLSDNLICICFSLSMLLLGVVVFRKKQDSFVLHI